MPLYEMIRLLSYTVPTSWSLVFGWKAGGILGGITGLIMGLALGFPCHQGISRIVYGLVSPQRHSQHTYLYWMAFLGLMWLVIAIWVMGFAWAGVTLTQFLVRNL